jgi:predicted lactoylglutathione lyase
VDAWWRALTEAGYEDDGPPGPRRLYGPEYYGAFVLDPDGNSVEAVCDPPRQHERGAVLDHVWIRVRDLGASRAFYEALAPTIPFDVEQLPNRVRCSGGGGATLSLVGGEPTEHVHLAFAASGPDAVDAFHRAGVEAGYRDNGSPGERPEYHPGYYGAFLLDPDGHNVEAVFHDR